MTSTELVWDRGDTASITSGAHVLTAGPCSSWPPALLLATAAGTSLFATFQRLAREADLPLLGYVAQQRADTDEETGEILRVAITACISVSNESAAAHARALLQVATRTAPILRVLRCDVQCESNVVALDDESPDSPRE